MPNKNYWFRVNNFYDGKRYASYWGFNYISLDYIFDEDPNSTNVVAFLNMSPAEALVRSIKIIKYTDNTIKILIEPSPLKYEAFSLECFRSLKTTFRQDTLFKDNNKVLSKHIKNSLGRKVIEIVGDASSLLLLLQFFEQLNLHSEIEEFPEILFSELVAMYDYLHQNIPHDHFIAEPETRSPVYREFIPKNRLFTLLTNYPKNPDVNQLEIQLKQLLAEGDNPNYQDVDDTSLLYHATRKFKSPVMLQLLLCYGAQIMVTNRWDLLTPLEFAMRSNNLVSYNLLNTAYQQSKIIYRAPSNESRVRNIQTFISKNKVSSSIQFVNNLVITSELKAMSALCPEELVALFCLYEKIYQASQNDIRESFAQTFTPDNGKFINLLRDASGAIIGAVASIVREENHEIYVLVDQSFLHPKYQGIGIMPLFDYQLPFALQNLTNTKTSILFLAASYNAWRRVQNIPCFPKYQNKQSKNQIKHLFNEVFNARVKMTDTPDGVFCTVSEETKLSVTTSRKPKTSIMEDFFYNHLCANSEGYVPVLVLVAEELLVTLQTMLQIRGIDFKEQNQVFATALNKTNLLASCNFASFFSAGKAKVFTNPSDLVVRSKL